MPRSAALALDPDGEDQALKGLVVKRLVLGVVGRRRLLEPTLSGRLCDAGVELVLGDAAVVDVVDVGDVAVGQSGLAETARRADEGDDRDQDHGEEYR